MRRIARRRRVGGEWWDCRRLQAHTSKGETVDFFSTHGERGLPSRGERSMRYTVTPEPCAMRTILSEGGTRSDSRRSSAGGEWEGVVHAGVQSEPWLVFGVGFGAAWRSAPTGEFVFCSGTRGEVIDISAKTVADRQTTI